MTYIPRYEPTFIGDAVAETSQGLLTAQINDAKITIHIEAQELRELARVREFIFLNFERGLNPLTQQPWRLFFLDNNIVIKYWEPSDPEQVNFDTIQLRTRLAQGKETMERTDLETLWYVDMDMCCDVSFNIQLNTDQGIIKGIVFTLEQENLTNTERGI